MVLSAIKTRTKTNTYLERKSIFWGGGLPQQFRFLPFWRSPGAPDTVKYDTFGAPGALSQKTHTQTHTHAHTHWPLGATNTHTDCTQTHTRIAHKRTHGLHTNTHILLPMVVFAIKTGTKTHTYL